jgi:NAD(P)-dependent dehydrogenase (short-subunit alcohol dehydrogenase family)
MAGALAGKVALVTGASRGLGKGIALGLGAAGATVYVTGRSTGPDDGPVVFDVRLPGTVGETAAEVTARGGKGVACPCDHHDDAQVRAVFDRIMKEHGQLDILVNNAFYVPSDMLDGKPFWEFPIAMWDEMWAIGVRSSFVTTWFGAKIMTGQGSGLIVNTTGPGAVHYRYTPAYGVGKTAVDRMTWDTAQELRPHNVAVVSLWPGLISTERTKTVAAVNPQFDLSWSETPELAGRAVAALATEPAIMERSGHAFYVAELAIEYGFTDADGTQPASRRELFGGPIEFRAS